jgi:group I intron endonuclease
MLIYKAENLKTGKIYVGKTVGDLESRKWGHLHSAKVGSKTVFHNSIRKHGPENFKFSILEECPSGVDLSVRERFYISELKSRLPNGYNMTDGGDGNDGTIKPNLGLHLSEPTKEKIRKANLGKRHLGETRIKISTANKGKHSAPKGPSPKKGIPSGITAWNKGLDGFLAGRTAWNKGLTKADHPAVAAQAQKMAGKIAWNKGLTKEADERVEKYATSLSASDSSGVFKQGRIPWNKGLSMVHSDDSNRKRSETMKGKLKSEETKERMRLAQAARRAKAESVNIKEEEIKNGNLFF